MTSPYFSRIGVSSRKDISENPVKCVRSFIHTQCFGILIVYDRRLSVSFIKQFVIDVQCNLSQAHLGEYIFLSRFAGSHVLRVLYGFVYHSPICPITSDTHGSVSFPSSIRLIPDSRIMYQLNLSYSFLKCIVGPCYLLSLVTDVGSSTLLG